ncbi:MAG: 3-methyl-2-oxobutanoate dehydrogenase subunit VorB [Clostridia bacterium]|jgi:2-oxoglutarate ferredoxin oxidoreductase subunit alpha|nr:3-methyl-2-oxobutanoate dehydrogenase subunit VorB [Clostridia bacterium]
MAEKVLMKGNEAIAEAAIRAGCRHYFGYPITPQTEVAAYMAKRMPKIGGCFLQAESEIAAINMVYGVAGAGKRVMTSSSSPGISLKSEGLSYLAGSDLPAFVVNVQRGGPGLGGIQPSQSDYFQATKGGGHGDYKMIVLAPASVQEMASLTIKGFDLADKYRMTAMILADGTMGQMMEPVELGDVEVKEYDKSWAVTGTKCQRPHNIVNSLSLVPEELEQLNFARYERYKAVEENEVMYESYLMDDAEICVVAFGISARVSKNAINEARKQGIKVGMIRPITLWPFPKAPLLAAADHCRTFISVEMNMGQMIEDIELAIRCRRPVTLCNRVGGMIPAPEQVLEAIQKANEGGQA